MKADFDHDAVCRFVQPFWNCSLPEMLVVGILFYFAAALCLYFFFLHARSAHSSSTPIFDQTAFFWLSWAVTELFFGTCRIFYFPWTPATFRLVYVMLTQILMFIANCSVVLLLFQLLFTFRNPGGEAVGFFQIVLFVFLFTFIAICVVLSIVEIGDNSTDADRPFALWCGIVQFVCTFFFVLPARALIRAVTFPVVQKEDRGCVAFSKVAVVLYALVYCGRAIWNITHYFGINVLQTAVYEARWNAPGVRAFSFLFAFLFDVLPSGLAIVSVFLLRKHDLLFSETVHFSQRLQA
jgi:hypothetical protein